MRSLSIDIIVLDWRMHITCNSLSLRVFSSFSFHFAVELTRIYIDSFPFVPVSSFIHSFRFVRLYRITRDCISCKYKLVAGNTLLVHGLIQQFQKRKSNWPHRHIFVLHIRERQRYACIMVLPVELEYGWNAMANERFATNCACILCSMIGFSSSMHIHEIISTSQQSSLF